MKGRTTIAIAHRLSTLYKADRIWCESGRLEEGGPESVWICRAQSTIWCRLQSQLGRIDAPRQEYKEKPDMPKALKSSIWRRRQCVSRTRRFLCMTVAEDNIRVQYPRSSSDRASGVARQRYLSVRDANDGKTGQIGTSPTGPNSRPRIAKLLGGAGPSTTSCPSHPRHSIKEEWVSSTGWSIPSRAAGVRDAQQRHPNTRRSPLPWMIIDVTTRYKRFPMSTSLTPAATLARGVCVSLAYTKCFHPSPIP